MKTDFIDKDNFDCIVCGNKEFKFIFSDLDNYVKATKKNFSIFKCLNCELIEIDPKISENDFKIIFTVESTGALQPDEIVVRAMKILQAKLTSLQE